MFITFEGIDGSGKSTLAQMLADYLGYTFLSTPGKEYAPIREAATRNTFSSFHYYVSSCYAVSSLVKDQSIVCDRYIHSTLAYNWPFTQVVPQDAFLPFPNLEKPDLSFLLTASRSVRLTRMLKRKELGVELTVLDLEFEAQDKAQQILMKFDDMIVIDTSDLCQEQVFKKVISHIKV